MNSKFVGNAVLERIGLIEIGVLINEQNKRKIVFLVNQIHRKAQRKLKDNDEEKIAVLAGEVATINAIILAIKEQFNKALEETLSRYLKIKTDDVLNNVDNNDIFVHIPNQKLVKQ